MAEDYRKSTQDKPNLPKWQDVQKFRTWPPYQVSDAYYPFNNSSVEDFTIGGENCEKKASVNERQVRNKFFLNDGASFPGKKFKDINF